MRENIQREPDFTHLHISDKDRRAAWPFRPACYKPEDHAAWMAGQYDKAAPVIKAFADHRLSEMAD